MKNNEQLINNIIGQLNGIKRMISEEKDCLSVMNQLKAARSAFDSLAAKFFRSNLEKCLKERKKASDPKLEKLLNEMTRF
jgi:CsoR family transcriptional regulator, copper-sensing transcriptional repressor